MKKSVLFGGFLLFSSLNLLQPVSACLCLLLGSTYKCPAAPTCCESGYYALDECGCCKKCAKAELQTCGGASEISGKCGAGLQCLKTCLPCTTVGSNKLPCIFPFRYGNETYSKCTSRDSDFGQPWCATAVDETGHVIDHAWGDCSDGCPGTRIECDERYFSIEEGKCIDVSVPGAIPNWVGAPVVKLEKPTDTLFPAPICQHKTIERVYENTCRCARGETALDFDLNGVPRGNCTGLEDDLEDNLDKVWCFLENIRDPEDPVSGCYSDTTWSARDGRYWSALACKSDPDVDISYSSRSAHRTPFTQPRLPHLTSKPVAGPTQAPRLVTTSYRPVDKEEIKASVNSLDDDDDYDDYEDGLVDVNYNYKDSYDYNTVEETIPGLTLNSATDQKSLAEERRTTDSWSLRADTTQASEVEFSNLETNTQGNAADFESSEAEELDTDSYDGDFYPELTTGIINISLFDQII